jgi:superfamily II DNA/RNA helicase
MSSKPVSASASASASSSSSSSSASVSHVSDERPITPPYGDDSIAGATADDAEAPALREYPTFEDMPIPENLLRGLLAYGFDTPSDIQKKGIVPIISGRDFLGQARSGTGKTCTYLTGGISRIDYDVNEVQMVVLVPVRELADQIADVAKGIGAFMGPKGPKGPEGIRVHVGTGGTSVREDLSILQQSPMRPSHIPHILVATPGRFYDLLNRKAVNPATVRVLVMDEADQMLEARFLEQIHCILSVTWPPSTQVVLMSATMIEDVKKVAKGLLRKDCVKILVPPEEVTLEGIKQWFVPVEKEEHKLDTLCDLYDHLTITQANIFVNTKEMALKLAGQMRKRGFDLDCIHGDMTMEERREHMADFRTGKTRVLISTDMLARGIDVQQVQLVINYELPVQRENYIHRIGRSARYGRKGASINLVSEREYRAQEEIEKYYSTKIRELPMSLEIY